MTDSLASLKSTFSINLIRNPIITPLHNVKLIFAKYRVFEIELNFICGIRIHQ